MSKDSFDLQKSLGVCKMIVKAKRGGILLIRTVIERAAFFVFCLLVILLGCQGNWEAAHPQIVSVTVSCEGLPSSFDGYRILQISDLHGRFLEEEDFWRQVEETAPDVVVFTGDALSRGASDERIEAVGKLIARLSKQFPVYYVGGNHEAQAHLLWEKTSAAVLEGGGIKLSDEGVLLTKEGQSIHLLGLRDPARRPDPRIVQKSLAEQTSEALETLMADVDGFSLLLAHRPEDVPIYAACGADLVLCGHTHGGQVRTPFGAIFAPGQGFFPQYSAGLYQVEDTQLYISQGLGGDFRILCRPQVDVITLRCA